MTNSIEYNHPSFSKLWVHKLNIDRDSNFIVLITEDDTVAIRDDWEFGYELEDLSKDNLDSTFSRYKKKITKELLQPCNDSTMSKELQKFKSIEIDLQELREFFFEYLNVHEYLEDLYIDPDLLEDTLKSYFDTPRNNCTEKVNYISNFESLLHHFLHYFLLSEIEVEIEEDNYDLYISDKNKEHKIIWENVLDLILSCFNLAGSSYEYNDGAYNRESGYNRESALFLDIENNCKDSLFEREINNNNNDSNSRIVIAKRGIIQFLQAHAPMGIRNLKKLNTYLFTT